MNGCFEKFCCENPNVDFLGPPSAVIHLQDAKNPRGFCCVQEDRRARFSRSAVILVR